VLAGANVTLEADPLSGEVRAEIGSASIAMNAIESLWNGKHFARRIAYFLFCIQLVQQAEDYQNWPVVFFFKDRKRKSKRSFRPSYVQIARDSESISASRANGVTAKAGSGCRRIVALHLQEFLHHANHHVAPKIIPFHPFRGIVRPSAQNAGSA
jgi:hypothetical protein